MFKSVAGDGFQNIWRFIKYWHFRYSLITATYILDTWEAVLLNVLIFITIFLLSAFNAKVVLRLVELLFGSTRSQTEFII